MFKVGDKVRITYKGAAFYGLEGTLIRKDYYWSVRTRKHGDLCLTEREFESLEITQFQRDVRAYIDKELGA